MGHGKSHTLLLLLLALAAGLLCGQCKGKKEKEDAGPPLPRPAEPEPGDTGEVLVDLGSSEPYELEGGISLQVLDLGSVGAAGGRTIRVKPDTGSQVPVEIEGFLCVSPQIEILSDALAGIYLVFTIPFSSAHLPGGIEKSGVFGAVRSESGWIETPSFIVSHKEAVCAVVPAGPVRAALLADPRHFTAEAGRAEGIAAIAMAIEKESIMGRGIMEAARPAGEGGAAGAEGRIITYLDGGERKINFSGTVVVLKRVKTGEGMALPMVVLDASGNPLKKRSLVRDALLAGRLAEVVDDEAAIRLAGILKEQKVFVEKLLPDFCKKDFFSCQSIKQLLYAIGDLSSRLEDGSARGSGDFLLALLPQLVWITSRLERLWSDPDVDMDETGMGESFQAAGIADILSGAQGKKGKGKIKSQASHAAPCDFTAAVQGRVAGIGEAGKSLAQGPGERLGIDEHAFDEAAAFFAGEVRQDILARTASALYGAARYDDVLKTAETIAGSTVQKAPSPDTGIDKVNVKDSSMVVKLKGTDEDGRVTAFRYWVDTPKLPGTLKGGSAAKIDLQSLGTGMHTFYAASVDNDDQHDETPASYAFYVRRFAEVSVKGVESSFDGPARGVNSEHKRSADKYAREVEAAIVECAQEHFRFGIDGKGTIKLGMAFKGGAVAGYPSDKKIISLTYKKNKALGGCCLKALKTGRLRYNQPYRPSATVNVSYTFKPTVLFFDADTIAGTPGSDATGAVVYKSCMDKAMKKIEAKCRLAVSQLAGPWDIEEAGDEEGEDGAAGESQADESGGEAAPEGGEEAEEEEEPVAEPEEEPEEKEPDIKIPEVEFDPLEIKKDCVKYGIKYLVAKCSSGVSKKRLWCVDSCLQKSAKCEKQCKAQDEFEMEPNQCIEDCWVEFVLPCSRNCVLKNTPFEEKEEL